MWNCWGGLVTPCSIKMKQTNNGFIFLVANHMLYYWCFGRGKYNAKEFFLNQFTAQRYAGTQLGLFWSSIIEDGMPLHYQPLRLKPTAYTFIILKEQWPAHTQSFAGL